MNRLLLALLLAACFNLEAATSQIRVIVTITNVPTDGSSFTLNGDTRYWRTNPTTPSIMITLTNQIIMDKTNMLQNFSYYPFTTTYARTNGTSTNSIQLVGALDQAMTAIITNAWGTILYVTNTTGIAGEAIITPMSAVNTTIRTNASSGIIDYLNSDTATNVLSATALSLTNYVSVAVVQNVSNKVVYTSGLTNVTLGVLNQTVTNENILAGTLTNVLLGVKNQTVTNENVLGGTLTNINIGVANATITNLQALGGLITNTVLSGRVSTLTNGYWTNAILHNPTTTNLVNRGSAISSPGSGAASEQFGAGAGASGANSLAISGGASGTGSTAVGYLASAGNYATALGTGADASGGYSGVALGQNTGVSTTNGIAIGKSAQSLHTNAIALGAYSATTSNFQIRVGTSSEYVSIPGQLWVEGWQTNATLAGNVTNNSSWTDTVFINNTLANGNNIAVALGLVTYIKLTAGPSAAFTICGIQNGWPSRRIQIWNNTGQAVTLAQESGVDPTPANRLNTLTGGDVTFPNDTVFNLRYDVTTSRWILGAASRSLANNIAAPGANTYVTFNDNGVLNGVSTLTFTKGSGRLGVNVTVPDQFLQVAGTATGEGAHIANGNVGVWAGGATDFALTHNSLFGTSTSYALRQGTNGATYLNCATASNIFLMVNNVEKVRVHGANGYVKFGSPVAPEFPVDIAGALRVGGANGIYFGGSSATDTNCQLTADVTSQLLQLLVKNNTFRIPGVLYSSYLDMTATNTTSAFALMTNGSSSNIGSTNFAANGFTAGKVMHIDARGIFSTSVAGPTLTFRINVGGTTVMTTGAVNPATATDSGWHFTGDVTCKSVGSGGTAIAGGELLTVTSAAGVNQVFAMVNQSTFTLNTTIANGIEMTAQWSATTAGNHFRVQQCVIEFKN